MIYKDPKRGIIFRFDKKDLLLVKSHAWFIDDKGYIQATAAVNGEHRLHRILMNPPGDYDIDHIDEDKTNNRRSNLRVVTKSLNSFARSFPDNELATRGVSRHGNRYRARIGVNNEIISLGTYDTVDEAFQVYIDACIRYFKEVPPGVFNTWLT